MLAGLVPNEPRDFVFEVSVSGSTSGSDALTPLGYGGYLVVYWTEDFFGSPVGLSLEPGHTDGGDSPGDSGEIYSDFFGLALTGAGAGARFEWLGVELYSINTGVWYAKWTSAKAYIGGVLVWSDSGGTYTSPRQPAPCTVPVVGIYPQVGASAIVPVIPVGSGTGGFPPAIPAVSYSAIADATGTWTFSGASGTATITATGHAEKTTTADASVAINYFQQEWNWACGSWDTKVVRMGSNQLAVVFRMNLPEVFRADVDVTLDYSAGPSPGADYPVVTGGTTYTSLKSPLTQYLEVVTDGTATIESPFSGAPAPFLNIATTETLTNPSGWVVHSVGSRISGDDCVPPGQCAPDYDHAYWGFRYFNTWLHPHWSFGLPFYGDTTQWPNPGDNENFWYIVKRQWTKHSSLPPSPYNDRLNSIVADPITQNGLAGYFLATIGTPCGWGLTTFDAMPLSGPASFLLDERAADRFTFAGDGGIGSTGTGSVDSGGIHIDDPGWTVDFYMSSTSSWPYLSLHACDRITIPGIGSGYSKVEAFLIGVDGADVKIGETTGSATTMRIPRGTGLRSGTTAGHDAGGAALTDTFSGASASDISLAVAASADDGTAPRVVQFGMGARIRFVLTRTGAGPITMGFPEFFRAPWSDSLSFSDTSSTRAVLFADGPMFRYGLASYFDYALRDLINPPNGTPAYDLAPAMGDAYCFRRHRIEGKQYDEDLATELFGRYTVEEHGGSLKEFWSDPDGQRDTHSFLVQGETTQVLCASNSYRGAVRPLGMFPLRERTKASNWADTGDYVMATYALNEGRHLDITTSRPTLEKPIGTDLLTDDETGPSGWEARSHHLAVTMTELTDHALRSNGKTWAAVRPWRGFVWWPGGKAGKVLAFLSRADGRLFRIVEREGTAWLGVTDVPTRSWTDVDLGVPATEASLQRGRGDRVLVGLLQDGNLTVRIEAAEGNQPPIATMDYGPATSQDLASFSDGTHLCARIDGGTVKLEVWNDRDLTSVAGPFDTNVTGLPDDATIRIDDARKSGNQRSLILLVGHGGDTDTYITTDLQTLTA